MKMSVKTISSCTHVRIFTIIERNTGARGLRAIIEGIMMKPMYELPSDKTVKRVIVTAKYVKGLEDITIIRDEQGCN